MATLFQKAGTVQTDMIRHLCYSDSSDVSDDIKNFQGPFLRILRLEDHTNKDGTVVPVVSSTLRPVIRNDIWKRLQLANHHNYHCVDNYDGVVYRDTETICIDRSSLAGGLYLFKTSFGDFNILKNIKISFDRPVSSYFVLYDDIVDPTAVVLDYTTLNSQGYNLKTKLYILSDSASPLTATIEYDGYLFTTDIQEYISKSIRSIRN